MSLMPNQAAKVDARMKGTQMKPAFWSQSLPSAPWGSPPDAPKMAVVIDSERAAAFEQASSQFETIHHLTLQWTPAPDSSRKASSFFFELDQDKKATAPKRDTAKSGKPGKAIDPEGRVSGRTAGSPDSATSFGALTIHRFVNPAGMLAVGSNVLHQTEASGAPITGSPGATGLGLLKQGFIERSNVQIVNELVNLIVAQRAYEVNSRAIQASDQMLSTGE